MSISVEMIREGIKERDLSGVIKEEVKKMFKGPASNGVKIGLGENQNQAVINIVIQKSAYDK